MKDYAIYKRNPDKPNYIDVEWARDFKECICRTFCTKARVNCQWCQNPIKTLNHDSYKVITIGEILQEAKKKRR